ncbi:hypothetical protein PITC_031340 [Penicillium italicum]|uniref:Uncharacterized protein n=1 Tax=Penicillium italicum TaxID=40296 RepID=A0A0A2L506_PENIT|nr:hypothetical protein PITC_031340 [Penicillium italicum]
MKAKKQLGDALCCRHWPSRNPGSEVCTPDFPICGEKWRNQASPGRSG